MRTVILSLIAGLLAVSANAQTLPPMPPLEPPTKTPPGQTPSGQPPFSQLPGTQTPGNQRPATRRTVAEPWFRACVSRARRTKFSTANAIFLCACSIGGVTATNRLSVPQKLRLLRSTTFTPPGAPPTTRNFLRRVLKACLTRLKAYARAKRQPVGLFTRYRVGWFHRSCMRRMASRTTAGKALRFCDCWLKQVRFAVDISRRSKTAIVSTSPTRPEGGPPAADRPGITAAAKRCAPTLRQ
jgi:hypothetical protein